MPNRNILFISHDATKTGAPTVLLHLLRYLKSKSGDVQFEVMLKSGGPLEHEFASLAPTYLWNRKSSRVSRPILKMLRTLNTSAFENFIQSKKPVRLSSEKKYDIIFANSVVSSDLAVELKKQLQIPVVLYVHELEVGIRQFFGLDKFENVKGAVDFIIGSSKMVVDNLRKNHGIPEGKLGLIYDFIPAKEYYEKRMDFDVKEIRNMLSIPHDAFVVGSSGTLDWRKGVDLIPQIARLTKQYSSKPVYFLWIGGSLDEIGMDKLMYDVEKLGVSNRVKFIDYDLKYFSILDAFLLSSREDPFPLVCLQAASFGKPILCFDDAGGMPEFVGDECGFVIPYLHVEKVAEKLHELASNRELRDVLGEKAAEKVVARHDVAHAADQILQAIDRVIKNN